VAKQVPAHALFIPGHPIAGTEFSGPEAGVARLFENRWMILTPMDDPRSEYARGVATLEAFWRELGANVAHMRPDRHDLVLAITSHLPHLIAFNIVATAEDLENVTESEVVKYSAGGFRDFTRIAASDPTMWRDVFLNNKEAVLEVLGRFTEDLAALQRAIRWSDGDTLFDTFTRARRVRREVIDAGQDIAAPNFGRGEK
jgi:cyclohexadieny/prephenate dehydrogenase